MKKNNKYVETYESYDENQFGEDMRNLPPLGRFEERIEKSRLIQIGFGLWYNYKGDLDFSNMGLNSLLEIPIRFNSVFGRFDCSYNNLISLEGAPSEKSESFYCSDNKLTSLQYASKYIYRNFFCMSNFLLSNKHNSKVGGNFIYYDNPFEITNDVIEAIKKMTTEQQISQLNFFKNIGGRKAYKMMEEILNDLGFDGVERRILK